VKNEPKIILWDIESLPNLKQVMQIFPSLSDYPGLTLKASLNSMICFGYQIFGEKEIKCINAWDFPGWKKNINDDRDLVMAAYEILKDADATVTHNGKRFDIKFLQTRLLYHGLTPLPKIRHIDTCAEAKRNLLMFNNRLNTISKFLTSEEKLENGGWDLWVKVMNREEKAMELMSRYCKQDVKILNNIFKKIRPFVTNIPNYNHYRSIEKGLCPSCGGSRLTGHGQIVRKSGLIARFLCRDCGSCCQRVKESYG
jgi:DNA polymerase elongation subunit (family B)